MHTVHSVQRDKIFFDILNFYSSFFLFKFYLNIYTKTKGKRNTIHKKKHQMYSFSKKQRLLQYLQCFINKIKNPSIIVKHAALGLLWGKRSKWFSSSCQSAPWKEKTIYKKESDLIKKNPAFDWWKIRPILETNHRKNKLIRSKLGPSAAENSHNSCVIC